MNIPILDIKSLLFTGIFQYLIHSFFKKQGRAKHPDLFDFLDEQVRQLISPQHYVLDLKWHIISGGAEAILGQSLSMLSRAAMMGQGQP